ncbi:MAG TPA: class I SAM-dependent methyltransferase [Bacteroidia bacterium]|nr:class I SAM-dependent methyltransferase [Bacteroidia bacterium]
MSDIYNDQTYLSNNPDWHEGGAAIKTKEIIRLLNRHTLSFKTICEVGCGSGEILVELEKNLKGDISYSGFDISKDAMTIAKKKETGKIKFFLKDIADESRFFDLILVIDVIEHIENYFQFLDKIVSRGEYTVFHIPLDMSVWTIYREKVLIESKKRVGHIHNFTEDFIISVLEDHGFKVIDKIYTKPMFESMTVKQRIANGIRKFTYLLNKKFATKFMGGYSIMVLCKNTTISG